MAQKFERVTDHDGEPIPWLYVRRYGGRKGARLYYAIFTDWQHKRRWIPLGKNLSLHQAIKKLGDVEKKNTNEWDFDDAKAHNVTLTKWANECSNAMRERDASLLAHLDDHLGSKLLSKITDKDVIDYRAKRLQEFIVKRGKPTAATTSPTTVNKELGLLRKLLRLAYAQGHVKVLPKFTMDREPNRERKLSAAEYETLLTHCPIWLRRVCIAAYETALSRGDLVGLKWTEVDKATWVIALKDGRDKTKVRQEIPIRTVALVELFRELEDEYRKLPNTEGLVLTCNGRRITPMQLRRALQRAMKAAGIADFTFHDFRHCAITRWHAMNVPVSAAMRMAGHSSVQSHKKYVNLGTQELIEVLTNCLRNNSADGKSSVST